MSAYRECLRRFARLSTLRLSVSLGAVGLAACSVVGPTSIDQGRIRYNDVIHDTYAQQTLLNLVRVYNHESPMFMDVTEVDAATTAGATVAGGPSAIGSSPNYKSTSAGTISGTLGFVTGGATYAESPTVRYQPLLGQSLVAQIQTPLSAEDFAKLLNAQWPLVTVLTLGTVGMTPGFSQKYAAIDAIVDLDHYGAVTFAAISTEDANARGNKMHLADNTKIISVVVNNANSEKKKDALTLYRTDKRSNHRSGFIDSSYVKCEAGGYVPQDANISSTDASRRKMEERAKRIVEALWDRLRNIYGQDPEQGIFLSTSSGKGRPPLLVTRSAISIMQQAEEVPNQSPPIIEFVQDPQLIENAVATYKANDTDCQENFYMLGWLKSDADSKFARNYSTTLYPEKSNYSEEDYAEELQLAHQRRYMLIAETDSPPPSNVYVSVEHRGKWYYILNDDIISQRALMLLTQFNTILATPPASPPLTPSISVGAR